MTSKISVSGIVQEHLRTLKHEHNQKYSGLDLVTFFGVPVVIAGVLAWFNILFGKTISSALSTSFSVFAALLFNLLILLYTIVSRSNGTQYISSLRVRFLRQIYGNVAYSVLASILIIVLLLVYYLVFSLGFLTLARIAAFFVYALSANFILTILMVLKRVHTLFSTEFDKPADKPVAGQKKTA